MANVPATKLAALKLARTVRNSAGGPSASLNALISTPKMPPPVQVPTDKRQPSARVKALRAISPKQQL